MLRSSIREFLCSEAMAALGIPSTRAASLVTSDLYVSRDPLNNGQRILERCSVVLRVAPTFIRLPHRKQYREKNISNNGVFKKQMLSWLFLSFFFIFEGLALLKSFWAEMNSQVCRVPVPGGMISVLSCWIILVALFILKFSGLTASGKTGIWLFSER